MKKEFYKKSWFWIVIFAVILVFYLISSYNGFVSLEQEVNAKWSEVENQYQRQADLIPNLVSIVSSSVKVETKFVQDVIAQRTAWVDSQSQLGKDKAGVEMNNGLTAFVNAVAENYPTLQANKQYIALTDEVAGTQNRISVSRGRYIDSIKSYNTKIMKFPARVIATMFGFENKEYYSADESSMKTPSLGSGQLP